MISNTIWLGCISLCYFLYPVLFALCAIPVIFMNIEDIYHETIIKKKKLNLIGIIKIILCILTCLMVVKMLIKLSYSDNPNLIFLFIITSIPKAYEIVASLFKKQN